MYTYPENETLRIMVAKNGTEYVVKTFSRPTACFWPNPELEVVWQKRQNKDALEISMDASFSNMGAKSMDEALSTARVMIDRESPGEAVEQEEIKVQRSTIETLADCVFKAVTALNEEGIEGIDQVEKSLRQAYAILEHLTPRTPEV